LNNVTEDLFTELETLKRILQNHREEKMNGVITRYTGAGMERNPPNTFEI